MTNFSYALRSGAIFAALICADVSSADLLRHGEVQLTFGGAIGTDPVVTTDTFGASVSDILVVSTSSLSIRSEWRSDIGDQFFLEPRLSFDQYLGDSSLNQLTIGVFGEYRHRLVENDDLQLRLVGGIEEALNPDLIEFGRATLQASLHQFHNARQNTQYRLRYRYRDQNEQTFAGFDQDEYVASVRHAWRLQDSDFLFSATTYTDLRRADARRYSYDEFGVNFDARYTPNEPWIFIGRLRGYARDYNDAFSNTYVYNRSDQRVAAELEIRYEFADSRWLYSRIGWDRNRSNVATRDYSGATFQIGLTIHSF